MNGGQVSEHECWNFQASINESPFAFWPLINNCGRYFQKLAPLRTVCCKIQKSSTGILLSVYDINYISEVLSVIF